MKKMDKMKKNENCKQHGKTELMLIFEGKKKKNKKTEQRLKQIGRVN